MIDPTREDVGRSVVYRPFPDAVVEEGVITSFNEWYVFVRFKGDQASKATRRNLLEWSHPD